MKGPSKAAFQFLICIKAKYILQKSTPKINQSIIQLAIRQFFQKFKNKTTKKQDLSSVHATRDTHGQYRLSERAWSSDQGGGCYHRSWIFCDGNNIFNLNSRFKMDAEYLCIIILSVGCVISVNSIFCVISVG
jgi:hypothetical protein